jgi:hypothetical protein
VPDVDGMAALDVLIGLFFLYFLLSLVCSAINEAISQIFNLRAHDLTRGVRNLLENEGAVNDFFGERRIKALYQPKLAGILGTRPPSYIPSRTFALALLDTVAPPTGDVPSRDLIRRARERLDDADNPLPPQVEALLRDALDEARLSVDKFRTSLERSFNEVMDRASGWYKRRVQIFLFVIAVVLVTAMNADSFTVADRLWKDDALRAAVAQQAQNQTNVESARRRDSRRLTRSLRTPSIARPSASTVSRGSVSRSAGRTTRPRTAACRSGRVRSVSTRSSTENSGAQAGWKVGAPSSSASSSRRSRSRSARRSGSTCSGRFRGSGRPATRGADGRGEPGAKRT